MGRVSDAYLDEPLATDPSMGSEQPDVEKTDLGYILSQIAGAAASTPGAVAGGLTMLGNTVGDGLYNTIYHPEAGFFGKTKSSDPLSTLMEPLKESAKWADTAESAIASLYGADKLEADSIVGDVGGALAPWLTPVPGSGFLKSANAVRKAEVGLPMLKKLIQEARPAYRVAVPAAATEGALNQMGQEDLAPYAAGLVALLRGKPNELDLAAKAKATERITDLRAETLANPDNADLVKGIGDALGTKIDPYPVDAAGNRVGLNMSTEPVAGHRNKSDDDLMTLVQNEGLPTESLDEAAATVARMGQKAGKELEDIRNLARTTPEQALVTEAGQAAAVAQEGLNDAMRKKPMRGDPTISPGLVRIQNAESGVNAAGVAQRNAKQTLVESTKQKMAEIRSRLSETSAAIARIRTGRPDVANALDGYVDEVIGRIESRVNGEAAKGEMADPAAAMVAASSEEATAAINDARLGKGDDEILVGQALSAELSKLEYDVLKDSLSAKYPPEQVDILMERYAKAKTNYKAAEGLGKGLPERIAQQDRSAANAKSPLFKSISYRNTPIAIALSSLLGVPPAISIPLAAAGVRGYGAMRDPQNRLKILGAMTDVATAKANPKLAAGALGDYLKALGTQKARGIENVGQKAIAADATTRPDEQGPAVRYDDIAMPQEEKPSFSSRFGDEDLSTFDPTAPLEKAGKAVLDFMVPDAGASELSPRDRSAYANSKGAMATDADFRDIYDKHLSIWEGGISTNKNDSGNKGGNATNMGVTQETYDHYRKKVWGQKGDKSVKKATREEAKLIAHDYWKQVRGDELPAPLAVFMLDAAYMSGPGTAARLLQEALRAEGFTEIKADGVLGSKTMDALQRVKNMRTLRGTLVRKIGRRYETLAEKDPAKKGFLKGWRNRLDAAVKMADTMDRDTNYA